MNKIYKIVWNKALGQMVVVSEHAKSAAKGTTVGTHLSPPLHKTQNVSACPQWLLCSLSLSMALVANATWAGVANTALPTGANITQGSAQISQNNNSLNITQNSQNLSTNWNSFNIGKDATVNFNQPNQSAIAVNRVLDNNASQIMGKLNANGQLFLLNPNGVIFSKTAQVNVGGIVASTLNLSDSDIAQGKFTLKNSFENQGNAGSVENYGSIIANGGVVALIAPTVKNHGTIQAHNGTVHLTAADQVTLQLQDGSLVEYQIDLGTLQGLVENGGAIQADNGAVYLTAKAKNSLSKAVVNHTGIIEANRLSKNAKGEIILLGDMQTGTTTVSGVLKAEGKNGQDGGFIETSAANVQIQDSTKVSTLSDSGKTGEWLIDPFNVTISNQAQAGNNNVANTFTPSQNDSIINVGTLNSALASNNITVTTAGAGTQAGNINVNADVTWNANTALTLRADNDIHINANITATGNTGKLNLQYGQTTSNSNASYYLNNGAKVNLKAGQNFSTQKGANAPINYTVITDLGAAGSTTKTDLQGMSAGLTDNYVLGADIDATATSGWNNGQGFQPIGRFYVKFDGLNHTISNLTINRPNQNNVGLFGVTNNATIQNIGLIQANIKGYNIVGALIGWAEYTNTSNAFSTGQVNGDVGVGGLVGVNQNQSNILSSYSNAQVTATNNLAGGLSGANQLDSRIENSYATGAVQAQGFSGNAGGLSGNNFDNSVIKNSYATGAVSGIENVGGLLGHNYLGNVENSYATGQVTRTSGSAITFGGLVGWTGGTIKNSYWNKDTTGQGAAVGNATGTLTQVQGLTTAQMKQGASFVGFNIDGQGGTGTVWRIYDGQTAPLLRSFLTQATLDSLANQNKTYNGQTQGVDLSSISLAGLDNSKIFAGQSSSKNVGAYNNVGYYSNQQGYDFIGGNASLTINKADLTLAGLSAGNKVYDATTVATLTGTASVSPLGSDSVTLGGTGIANFADKNVGNNKTVTVSGYTLSGADAGNYNLVQPTGLKANISKADLALAGLSAADKIYDATTTATLSGTAAVTALGSDAVSVGGTGAGTFADKNVGNNKTVTVSGYTLSGADAGNYNLVQPTGLKANISKADLALAGLSAADKIYDATTTATLSGTAAVTALGSDAVSVGGTGAGTFADKNVGTNKAVTVTGYTLSGTDAGNYNLVQPTGLTATISQRTLNATLTAQNKIYDGNTSASVSYGDDRIGQDVLVVSGTATFSDKNAGNGKTVTANNLALTGTDAGNYELASTTATTQADIDKATLTATITAQNKIYDGNNSASVSYGDDRIGQDVLVVSGTATFNDKNAATGKTVTANNLALTGTDAGNYVLAATTATDTADISKAQAIVTANSLNTVYNGQNQTASGFSATGLVNGEDSSVLTGVTASVTAKDAGSYTNKANGVDKNYDLTFVDGALEIAKAKATVTANSLNTVYNGQNQTVTGFSATGLVGGEDESVLTGVSTTGGQGKNAGSYSHTASGTDSNYDITFVDGALEIAKAKATVTANSLNTVYNGQNQTVTGFSATGLVGGEDESVLTGVSTTGGQGKNAGSYSHTASGTDSNYDITFVDGALEIAKAKATVTANSLNTVYNGQNQTVTGFSATGLVGGEDESVLTGISTTGGQGKNAGSYSHTASGTDSNYDITFVDGALEIAKAKATVTANSLNTVYNGQNQTVTGFSATGLVGGEDESVLTGVSTTGGQGKNAGSYSHTASGTDSNYDITFVDGALEIAKAKATVTANSLNTVYNGQNQTVTGFSATGLVGGEDESVLTGISTTGGQGKNAGSYSHTASGTDSNYDLTFVGGALEIAKAKATVTANSLNTVYNGKDQTVTGFSASGLVAGEDEAVLSNVSASVTAQEVGNYANKATGSDDNYELTFVDGVLSIQAKPIVPVPPQPPVVPSYYPIWGNPYQRAIRTQSVQQKTKAFDIVEIEIEGNGINMDNIQTLGSN